MKGITVMASRSTPSPSEDQPAAPVERVAARYVGSEPVMAPVDGVPTIIEHGDRLVVSAEQLDQNPIFEAWED